MIDPELKALVETLATKEDLKGLATKADLEDIRGNLKTLTKNVWDLAGDVARVDSKVDRLAETLRSAGLPV